MQLQVSQGCLQAKSVHACSLSVLAYMHILLTSYRIWTLVIDI
jgi:hypothetical protein